MSEGSVWIEGDEFCYIDEQGNKKCQDFEKIRQNLININKNFDRINDDVEEVKSRSDDFQVTIQGTNSPLELPGELAISVFIENVGREGGKQDIELIVGGDGDADGDVLDSREISLISEETETFQFRVDLSAHDFDSKEEVFFVRSEDSSDSSNVEFIYPEEFSVVIRNTNSPVDADETLVVDVDVTNVGEVESTQEVILDVDGVRDRQLVTIEPTNTASVQLRWEEAVSGKYTANVSTKTDNDSVDVRVSSFEGESFFNVEILDWNEPIPGEPLSVDVEIDNIADESDTQDIELTIAEEIVDSQSISLSDGESTQITLSWEETEAGIYLGTVSSDDDSGEEEFTVFFEGGPFFAVQFISTNSPIPSGGTIIADARVRNIGDEPDTQTIRFSPGYELGFDFEVDLREVSLESFEEVILENFQYQIPEDVTDSIEISVKSNNDEDFAEIIIGDVVGDDAGVIVHENSGNTIEGVFVEDTDWVEIFGNQIHFSKT